MSKTAFLVLAALTMSVGCATMPNQHTVAMKADASEQEFWQAMRAAAQAEGLTVENMDQQNCRLTGVRDVKADERSFGDLLTSASPMRFEISMLCRRSSPHETTLTVKCAEQTLPDGSSAWRPEYDFDTRAIETACEERAYKDISAWNGWGGGGVPKSEKGG